MSKNSLKRAEEAKKNPELLGSTNQKGADKPHKVTKTVSKVERSSVQAGKTDPKKTKGDSRPAKLLKKLKRQG